MLPWAHPSPQNKKHLDWFSHFCTLTAECHWTCLGMSFTLKIAPSHRPPPNTWFLEHPSQQPKQQLDQFSHFGRVPSGMPGHVVPLKLPLHTGWSGPPSNTWFPEPTQAHNPNGIWIGPAVFAQITAVSLYFTMLHPFPPPNCPFPWGDADSHLVHGSLGPLESSTQTISRSVQPFLQAHYCDRQTDRQTLLLSL